MSKLKHTPGPWSADRGFVIDEKEHVICQTFNRLDEDFENQEPNARLMAAAPKMLDVLIKLVAITTKDGFVSRLASPIVEKATGLSINEVLNDERLY